MIVNMGVGGVRNKLVVLYLGILSLFIGGCSSDALMETKQLPPITTSLIENTYYTSKVSDTLGSYYENTVTFLSEDCGAGAYSTATGKALMYGLGGGLWGASKGSLHGIVSGDSLQGMVIGSIVGSSVGLAVGVKNAYEGFKADTASCDLS